MARTHGVAATYRQAACRCQPCTEANTVAVKAAIVRRTERLAADPGVEVEHGKVSTYRNWGCRCEPCTTANAVAGREPSRRYRERQQAKKALKP